MVFKRAADVRCGDGGVRLDVADRRGLVLHPFHYHVRHAEKSCGATDKELAGCEITLDEHGAAGDAWVFVVLFLKCDCDAPLLLDALVGQNFP